MQDHNVSFLTRPYYLNAVDGDEEHLKIHVNSAILSAKSSFFKGLFGWCTIFPLRGWCSH
jgi:hypothetical protein